jgi:hypothetical protein
VAGTPRRIPGWIEISVHGTQEGSQRVNGFAYKWLGPAGPPPSVPQLTAMASAWYTACGAAYRAMCVGSYNFDYVEARWLDPAGPLIAGAFAPTQPAPGTQSGGATPANAAGVISWRTGALGRRYRGRTYLPAVSEAQTSGSTLLGAWITNATALALAIKGFTNGGGVSGVINVVASFVGQVLLDTLYVVIDTAVDSQRKRLIGRGR